MKTKATRNQTSISSRMLTIVGTASLLFVLPGSGLGDIATNVTSSTVRPAPVEVSRGVFTAEPTFSPSLPQAPAVDSMPAATRPALAISDLNPNADGPVLHQEIAPPMDTPTSLPPSVLVSNLAVLDSGAAGFVAARAFPDLTTIPARVVTTPLLGPSVLVLQEPRSDALNRYDPSGLKQDRRFPGAVAVRFFVPVSQPAAPGRGHNLVSGESDRPWPVVAAGAAVGRCWNDPGLYQPQNYLSLNLVRSVRGAAHGGR